MNLMSDWSQPSLNDKSGISRKEHWSILTFIRSYKILPEKADFCFTHHLPSIKLTWAGMNTALSWFEITPYTTLAAIAGYRIVASSVTILDSRPTRLAAGTPLLPFAPVSIDCKVRMRERSLVDLKAFLEMHEVWCLPTSKSCWTPVKPFYVGNKCNSNSLLKLSRSPYVANRKL